MRPPLQHPLIHGSNLQLQSRATIWRAAHTLTLTLPPPGPHLQSPVCRTHVTPPSPGFGTSNSSMMAPGLSQQGSRHAGNRNGAASQAGQDEALIVGWNSVMPGVKTEVHANQALACLVRESPTSAASPARKWLLDIVTYQHNSTDVLSCACQPHPGPNQCPQRPAAAPLLMLLAAVAHQWLASNAVTVTPSTTTGCPSCSTRTSGGRRPRSAASSRALQGQQLEQAGESSRACGAQQQAATAGPMCTLAKLGS